ncbi:MAG: OsmC family protein [Thermoleophilaceae bacterium]
MSATEAGDAALAGGQGGEPEGITSHHARVRWQGSKEDLRAHTTTVGGQAIGGSCSPRWGGDPAQADPEGLFVASLSTCHMLWFLDLARRERLRVTSYEDSAEGTMDESRFTHVALRPRVEFEREVEADTVARLHHAAHHRCYIANTVSCPVEVEPWGP